MEIVSELPGGTIIRPLRSRMSGPTASSIALSVDGEPVGAVVEVRAVITLVNALPKLKLTGVTVDPLTVAFRRRDKVSEAVAELAVTWDTYAVRPLPDGLANCSTNGAEVPTVAVNGIPNISPDMAALDSGREPIAGAT
ncbi:hypothetical protein D3C75_893420 [compost metagenome]